MEGVNDNDNPSNQFNDNGNGDEKKLLRTDISRRRKKSFWYDIQNFPDPLLSEILSRLPVKSIFRFKSVCKHWQTLISHPSFSRFYHSILDSNSNAAAALPFIFLERCTWVPVWEFKECINRLALEIQSSPEFSVLFLYSPNKGVPYDQIRVLDISNGLILCCWMSPKPPFVYYICDLLTKQWITIPRRGPQRHYDFCEGLITRVKEDHVLTGYTVVRFERLDTPSNCLNFEMFSSEKGKWIVYKLPCPIPVQLRELSDGPIHCYGDLHWPVVHHNGIHAMVAFDPYKDPKSVRLIPLPQDRDLWSEVHGFRSFQLCGECQGTLRYFELARDSYDLSFLKMWVMKDYEKGEWCCELKVSRSHVHSSNLELSNWLVDGCFLPVSFHPFNPNVVYLSCMKPECIVSYNLLNRRLDVVSKTIDINQDISCGSVIPYVLPTWPVLVSIANSKLKRVNHDLSNCHRIMQ